MNILDAIILILLASQALRWAHYGFSRGFFSLVGFWIGVIAGAIVSPFAMALVESPIAKLIIALLIIFGLGSIAGSVGRSIGTKLFHLLNKARLNWIDGIIGSVFGVVVTLGIVWLMASMFSGLPFQDINRQISRSAIIQSLNQRLPAPPAVLARIGAIINPSNFPQVFLGPEPAQIEPVNPPTTGDIARAFEVAGESTVRIESIGCGGRLTGSGFIADENIVVTNAHVIAGVSTPTVVDVNGRRTTETIYFDPRMDIAVLRVNDGLAGEPLVLASDEYGRGTAAVTLGYPEGGPLDPVPAAVLNAADARGLDIYGVQSAVRPIYILQTTVFSGNSGGPVVLPDGTVIGMIFARSEAEPDIGYAIRSNAVIPAVQAAIANNTAVDTGSCVNS